MGLLWIFSKATIFSEYSSQVRFRLILAGLPITREPSGITVFLVTRLPAPIIQSFARQIRKDLPAPTDEHYKIPVW